MLRDWFHEIRIAVWRQLFRLLLALGARRAAWYCLDRFVWLCKCRSEAQKQRMTDRLHDKLRRAGINMDAHLGAGE